MNRTDRKMKELINKIGLEQPTANFTTILMDKIAMEHKTFMEKTSIFRRYGFILSYLAAVLIIIPFVIPDVRHLMRINIQLVDIDFNVIREGFNQMITGFTQINLSATFFISVACSVMIFIFALNAFVDLKKRKINFS